MDVSEIAKEYARLQKQSFNNLFDTLELVQNHVDKTSSYWAYQMGIDKKAQTAADQWRLVLKQGCDDARKLINDGLTRMEVHFTIIDPKQPPE